ncbi:MAG: rRNA maturation RNase YbeY [Leptospiraceae bacterium]|nr:rRNA maturation RNase YbeY [Leptospiraceae bacterium]MCP5500929.1 rRNA maturation RNase YbeY [Leptospiraceae bacterium]
MPVFNFELDLSYFCDLDEEKIRINVDKVLSFVGGYTEYELSLLVTDDESIREINRVYRKKDSSTDVLSLPIHDKLNVSTPYPILGEIVISYDTLKRQALSIGHGEIDEFYRLLVHGILHLLGYDHELGEREELEMKEKEDECLSLIFTGTNS